MSKLNRGKDVTFEVVLIGISLTTVMVSGEGVTAFVIVTLELVAVILCDLPATLSSVGIPNFKRLRQFCTLCKKGGLTFEEARDFYVYEIKRKKNFDGLSEARMKSRGFWTMLFIALPDLLRLLLNLYALWWIHNHLGPSLVDVAVNRSDRVIVFSLAVTPRFLSLFIAFTNFLEGDVKCLKSCFDAAEGNSFRSRYCEFLNPHRLCYRLACDNWTLLVSVLFIGIALLMGHPANVAEPKLTVSEVRSSQKILSVSPSPDLYIGRAYFPIKLTQSRQVEYEKEYNVLVVPLKTYRRRSQVLVIGDDDTLRNRVLNESFPLVSLLKKMRVAGGNSSVQYKPVAFYESGQVVAIPLEGFKSALIYDHNSRLHYPFISSESKEMPFGKLSDRSIDGIHASFGPSIILPG